MSDWDTATGKCRRSPGSNIEGDSDTDSSLTRCHTRIQGCMLRVPTSFFTSVGMREKHDVCSKLECAHRRTSHDHMQCSHCKMNVALSEMPVMHTAPPTNGRQPPCSGEHTLDPQLTASALLQVPGAGTAGRLAQLSDAHTAAVASGGSQTRAHRPDRPAASQGALRVAAAAVNWGLVVAAGAAVLALSQDAAWLGTGWLVQRALELHSQVQPPASTVVWHNPGWGQAGGGLAVAAAHCVTCAGASSMRVSCCCCCASCTPMPLVSTASCLLRRSWHRICHCCTRALVSSSKASCMGQGAHHAMQGSLQHTVCHQQQGVQTKC